MLESEQAKVAEGGGDRYSIFICSFAKAFQSMKIQFSQDSIWVIAISRVSGVPKTNNICPSWCSTKYEVREQLTYYVECLHFCAAMHLKIYQLTWRVQTLDESHMQVR